MVAEGDETHQTISPELRAADLAEIMQMDKLDFKVNVRKLKNLGLTISHEIGSS